MCALLPILDHKQRVVFVTFEKLRLSVEVYLITSLKKFKAKMTDLALHELEYNFSGCYFYMATVDSSANRGIVSLYVVHHYWTVKPN